MTNAKITFIGPLPPPTHGQALATGLLMAALRDAALPVSVVDTSGGTATGLWRHLTRMSAHLRAAYEILVYRGPVYLSANSNHGFWLTVALATLAAVVRRPTFVHHHSYTPADKHLLSMDALTALTGDRARHVVLSKQMRNAFTSEYPLIKNIFTLNNAGLIEAPEADFAPNATHEGITVGHLSNLSAAKGAVDVVNIIISLVTEGHDIRLIMAGPVEDEETARAIERAGERLGARFSHLGAIYGGAKMEFFRSIDLFLFPTRYKNEASPLVLFEALATGTPVIAANRGCIAGDIGVGGGLVAPIDKLRDELARFIEAFTPQHRLNATRQARLRYCELLREHVEQLNSLVTLFNTALRG